MSGNVFKTIHDKMQNINVFEIVSAVSAFNLICFAVLIIHMSIYSELCGMKCANTFFSAILSLLITSSLYSKQGNTTLEDILKVNRAVYNNLVIFLVLYHFSIIFEYITLDFMVYFIAPLEFILRKVLFFTDVDVEISGSGGQSDHTVVKKLREDGSVVTINTYTLFFIIFYEICSISVFSHFPLFFYISLIINVSLFSNACFLESLRKLRNENKSLMGILGKNGVFYIEFKNIETGHLKEVTTNILPGCFKTREVDELNNAKDKNIPQSEIILQLLQKLEINDKSLKSKNLREIIDEITNSINPENYSKDFSILTLSENHSQEEFKFLGLIKADVKEDSSSGNFLEKTLAVSSRMCNKSCLEIILVDQTILLNSEIKKNELKAKSLYLAKSAHELKNIVISIMNLCNQHSTNSFFRIESSSDDEEEDKRISIARSKKRNSTINSKTTISSDSFAFIGSLSNFLLFLIEDINTFTKMEMNNSSSLNNISSNPVLSHSFTDVDLIGCLDFCLNIFKIRQKYDGNKKNVKIHSDYNISKGKKLHTNETKFKQVVINLLSNAYKFTLSGEVKLTACVIAEETRRVVRISVNDTGVGLSESEKELLFNPFKIIERNQKHNNHGSGLGLSIVNEILSILDSKLEFTSEKFKGANFWFDLPDRVFRMKNSSSSVGVENKLFRNETSSSIVNETLITEGNFIFTESMKNVIYNITGGFEKQNSNSFLRESTIRGDSYVIQENTDEDCSPKNQRISFDPIVRERIISPTIEIDRVNTITPRLGSRRYSKFTPNSKKLDIPTIFKNKHKTSSFKSLSKDKDYTEDIPELSSNEDMKNTILCEQMESVIKFRPECNIISKCVTPVSRRSQSSLNIKNWNLDENKNSPIRKRHYSPTLPTKPIIKLNILVCDDDNMISKPNAKLIEKICKEKNIDSNVKIVDNGIECIYNIYQQFINQYFYDIIFIDESMPFLKGSSVTNILRTMMNEGQLNEISIYVVSSYDQKYIEQEITVEGPGGILKKPLDHQQLKEIMTLYSKN